MLDMFTQGAASRLWPARLDSAQTARLLGCQEHDIPVLVSHELLEPLGKPAPNARKYFAAVDVQEKGEDAAWLNKATRILYQHWRDKNASRTKDESAPAIASLN